MKILNKFTKKSTKKINCDTCKKTIPEKNEKLCFHGEDFEVYMCLECAKRVFNEKIKEFRAEELSEKN